MKADGLQFVSGYVIAFLFDVVVPSSNPAIISVSALLFLIGLGGVYSRHQRAGTKGSCSVFPLQSRCGVRG
jgi:hypothetical protein